MSDKADKAWSAERKAHDRGAYVAGYDRGASDERFRVAAFLVANGGTIQEFAGDRSVEMVAFMLQEMVPGVTEMEAAFQARDWDTVRRLQDEAEATAAV